jgi:hypothetical protein
VSLAVRPVRVAHRPGEFGHRYHITRTAAGLVIVVAHDVITSGAVFDRHRVAPAAELASMATTHLADGERIEPISSVYGNGRTRDTWRVRLAEPKD